MRRHRRARCLFHLGRVLRAHGVPALDRPALRQIAVDRVVSRGLVREQVGADAARQQFGQYVGGVAEKADRDRGLGLAAIRDQRQGFVDARSLPVQIARPEPHLDARLIALDGKARGPGHDGGQRLSAAHAAKSCGQQPARHQIGVGDQHARRIAMCPEHTDRLARLDEQRLVAFQPSQRFDDDVIALPVARNVVKSRPVEASLKAGYLLQSGLCRWRAQFGLLLWWIVGRRSRSSPRGRLFDQGWVGVHTVSPLLSGDRVHAAAATTCSIERWH